jgi:hypothetical protein
MKEFLVTCVSKTKNEDGPNHVTHIGNNSLWWRITKRSAIRRIRSKKEAFYVIDRVSGKRLYIGVFSGSWRKTYLRTQEDGVWNDYLETLPECTTDCELL